MLEKSILPRNRPIGGITIPSTRSVMILPNAAPMITPTARSTTLPRARKCRNSFQSVVITADRLLDLHLHAEFDDAFRRQAEECGRPHGIACHQDEQLLAPDGHTSAVRDEDCLSPQ